MMPKIYISKINEPEKDIREALDWLELRGDIKPRSNIYIKPNLTYPYYKEGVTTSPRMIEALVLALKNLDSDLTIVESDGGYHSWKAEDAFRGHGLYDLSKRYGIRLLNLCKSEKTSIEFKVNSENIQIPFPKVFLNDVDLFITMPVPKIHAMTGVSLALKNQWGCVPDTMRLLYHWCFDEAVVAVNKAMPKSMVVADGTYMLDGNGPMAGDVIRQDMVIISDDIGVFELVACKIMNIEWGKIRHLVVAKREGIIPQSLDKVIFNQPIEEFCTRHFGLKKTVQNRLAEVAFHSKGLTKLGYNSMIGDFLHWVLYKIKGKPVWHE